MNLKSDLPDVPVELLRTLVVSVETGDVTEAERQLNLTRHEIEADLCRLEEILGDALFVEADGRRRLSGYGGAILSYARRLTSVNDELLRLAAKPSPVRRFSIGMPQWIPHGRMVEALRRCTAACNAEPVTFRCDEFETLMRDLNSGRLDLAFMSSVPPGTARPVVQWTEPLYWIKALDLVLRPGEPLRLVSWPGGISDRIGTRLLEAAGIDYSIAFSGRASAMRIAAVAAGLGLMLSSDRVLLPDICIAREAHLPTPPQITSGIYVRQNLDVERYAPVLRAFEVCMAPRPAL